MTDPSDSRQNVERARGQISVGTRVPDDARFASAKRLVLKLAHGVTAEQTEFNRSAVLALESLQAQVEGIVANHEAFRVELAWTRRGLLQLQANLATDEVSRAMAIEPLGSEGSTPALDGNT